MIAAWRLPGARFVTVEAQEESVRLARKSAAYNGLQDRYDIRHADFRDPRALAQTNASISCWPARRTFRSGAGIEGDHPQKVACRFELRGDISDYARVAAGHLQPGGFFACVFPEERRESAGIGGSGRRRLPSFGGGRWYSAKASRRW